MKRIIVFMLSALLLCAFSSCSEAKKTEEVKTMEKNETVENTKTTSPEESADVQLLLFYGMWNDDCDAMKLIVDEIADDYKNAVEVKKMDIDVYGEEMIQYGIDGYKIPTTLILKNGEELARFTTLVEKSEVTSQLDKALAK